MNYENVMKNFFTLYKDLLDETGLIGKPSHIFFADESGVDVNSKAGKVVVATKSKHAYSEQKSFRDHITTLVCCSASGLMLSPMIIFEKSWPSGPYSRNGPKDCLYAKSPNGYIDEELFLEWFKKIFVPETKHLRPTLLIIDGHGSHGANSTPLSYELLSLAKDVGIHILLLPPHTTNILQPLDVGVFRPFKVNLSKLTDGLKLLAVSGNYASINKTNFTAIFKEALDRTICLATIKNGFRKTGIYPYNPDAIDKSRLMPTINITSQPVEPPHSSKTPNETEKGGIMPVTVDEPQYSTLIQKPSQSNPESNSANTVNIIKNSTSSCKFDQTTSTLPGGSSSVDASIIIKNTPTSSAIDFSMSSTYHTPRITENILVDANIVPHHLADVFYQPPHTKQDSKTHPRIKLTGRVITSTEHTRKIKEKLEGDAKIAQEKLQRKEEQEKKRKEKEQATLKKQKKKNQKTLSSRKPKTQSENEVFSSSSLSMANIGKRSQRKGKEKVYNSIKQIIEEMKKCSLSESSSSSDDSSEKDFEEELEENLCFNCKSKYPPTKKQLRKIDWVQCDECDHWFHEFCVTRDESVDIFTCTDCF